MVVDFIGAQVRGHKGDGEDCCQCAMNRVDRYLDAMEMDHDRVQLKLFGGFVVGESNLFFATGF